uniref:Uncharacterized protein n=1 Tax=Romanomermis culicivorax TaxID=13658 RepID=A0A915KNM6_ROMCU
APLCICINRATNNQFKAVEVEKSSPTVHIAALKYCGHSAKCFLLSASLCSHDFVLGPNQIGINLKQFPQQ